MDKLETIKNKINDFSASCTEKIANYNESQEKDQFVSMYNYIDYVAKSMYNEIREARNYISTLESAIYQHQENHMPKLTAGQMQKLLDSCGASDDFEIRKPNIYISSNNRGTTILASYNGKENNK